MPDRKPRPERVTPHKDKICKTCGRAFSWRKKWAQDWDVVKYCSDACRGHTSGDSSRALEAAILSLLAERGGNKTICPSEAAKAVAADSTRNSGGSSGSSRGSAPARQHWERLMEPARAAARRLVAQEKIVITQHGRVVDPSTAKGPIRLRLR